MAKAANVQLDDLHGLADRDDGEAGFNGHPLRRAVPGARFVRLDGVVRNKLDGGAQNGLGVLVADNGAVHLRQFPQAGGGEVDADVETAGANGIHGAVEAEDDQGTRPAAQDAFEPVAEIGSRRDAGQSSLQRIFGTACHGHFLPAIGPTGVLGGRCTDTFPIVVVRQGTMTTFVPCDCRKTAAVLRLLPPTSQCRESASTE
jgi:hypothetical protein